MCVYVNFIFTYILINITDFEKQTFGVNCKERNKKKCEYIIMLQVFKILSVCVNIFKATIRIQAYLRATCLIHPVQTLAIFL